MKDTNLQLGLGIGWRPQLALMIERTSDLGFVEITHENHPLDRHLDLPIQNLLSRGVKCIPHGLTLNLGGGDRVDAKRLASIAAQALRVKAPLVSEHIAFVRAEGAEAGHLMPVERTWSSLKVVVENIKEAMNQLPVPLALENISTLFEWPGAEMDEGEFVSEVLEQTGALMLLDIENLYANARNHKFDAFKMLDKLPLERIAYVHIAGGAEDGGVYHDTHFHPVPQGVLDLLSEVASRVQLPGVMLERDDKMENPPAIAAELQAIEAAWKSGAARLQVPAHGR